jgi:Fe-S cluster biogenesis protein NfuA
LEQERGRKKDTVMREKIQKILDKEIKPALKRDGGDIELIEVTDGIVKVKLRGACAGCPMSQMTMTNFVERFLKERIPEVKKVEAVS